MSIIAHVDADCFYVSCERIRDSSLLGQAVGVLGNQGSCVIARSYEMKARGVTVAMPIYMAKKLCPEGIFIKRDFEWYGIISHQIQEILRNFTPYIEYYSVDESFMEFKTPPEDLELLAKLIQETVLREARIPVSIGFATSRTLAKLGSDKNKPFGITLIGEENKKEILEETPVEDVFGIGGQSAKKLKRDGIHTALDFIQRPREHIKRILNKPGEVLWYELQGKPVNALQTERGIRKSLSRGGQLWGIQKDPKAVYGFLVRNLERFVESLWHLRLESSELTVTLIEENNQSVSAQEQFFEHTDDYFLLLKASRRLFGRLYKKGHRYSAVHLYTSSLRENTKKQQSLFINTDSNSMKIKKIKEELSERFGPFSLRSASTAYTPEIFRDTASNYEICDIDGKVCF